MSSVVEVDATGPAEGAARDAGSEITSILADLSDVWAAQAQRWYDRARSPSSDFVPEDAVSDTIDLVEHLAPLLERSVALSIEMLRPLAVALQERQTDG